MHITPQTPLRAIIKHAVFLLENQGVEDENLGEKDILDDLRGPEFLQDTKDPLDGLWKKLEEVFIPLAQEPQSTLFELAIPKDPAGSSLGKIASQLTKDQAERFLREMKSMPHSYKNTLDRLLGARPGADNEKAEISLMTRFVFKFLSSFLDREKTLDRMLEASSLTWRDDGLDTHTLRVRSGL